MEKIQLAIEVTAKWISVYCDVSYDEAHQLLESYYEHHKDSVVASFSVSRVLPNNVIKLAIVSAEQIIGIFNAIGILLFAVDGEKATIHSLQKEGPIDPVAIATVNKMLYVPPRFRLAGVQVDEKPCVLGQKKTPEVTIKKDPVPEVKSIPAKSQPSVTVTKTSPAKKAKSSTPFVTKKAPVDLKSRMESDMFTADDNNAKETKPTPVTTTANNKPLVDFSSEDEDAKMEEEASKIEESIEWPPSPMKVDAPTEAPPAAASTQKMKMIKVPRTFMENGYMMTEYVSEWVPDDSPSPNENSRTTSSQENPSTSSMKSTTPSITKAPANTSKPTHTISSKAPSKDGKKQGSIMSFFAKK